MISLSFALGFAALTLVKELYDFFHL